MQNEREETKRFSDKLENRAPTEPTGSHWRRNEANLGTAAEMGVSPYRIAHK